MSYKNKIYASVQFIIIWPLHRVPGGHSSQHVEHVSWVDFIIFWTLDLLYTIKIPGLAVFFFFLFFFTWALKDYCGNNVALLEGESLQR